MADGASKDMKVLRVQLIAACLWVSTVIYAVVGAVYVHLAKGRPPFLEPGMAATLGRVFVVVGVVMALASFPVRRAVEARLLNSGANATAKLQVVMISMAIAEVPALLGLVYALLALEIKVPLILWACSLAAGAAHFPLRASLEEGKRGG